jgi:RNA polymerase sigma factor (sigma-70 family)
MSSRAPPVAGTRLDVLVANVVHLPPGDVEGQQARIEPAGEPSPLTARRGASQADAPPCAATLDRAVSEERLLELAGLGDERAWATIMSRHQAYLHACCRPIVGDSRAQDAVQQAFLSAWHALTHGCDVRNQRAWLATIARRAALQMLREEGPAGQPLPAWTAAESQPHDQHELLARARAALAAVAALPARERDALVWTSLHGRSTRETASALGVSEGALRQLVFRARARARAAAAGLLPTPLLERVCRLMSHGVRRAGGGLHGQLPTPLALNAGEGLMRLTPVLAAAALVGAPLAAVELTQQGAPHGRRGPARIVRQALPGQAERPPAARVAGSRAAVPARHAGAPGQHAQRGQKLAAGAGSQAPEPLTHVPPAVREASAAAQAAGAPSAAGATRSSGTQAGVPPLPTNPLPVATPGPAGLPQGAVPSAPSLSLPTAAGVTQQLSNTVGQVGGTVTTGTGAVLEAARTVGGAASAALSATPRLP